VHAKLNQHAGAPSAAALRKHKHVLFVLPPAKLLSRAWPAADVLALLIGRRRMQAAELAKSAVTGNLRDGTLASWMMLDAEKSTFDAQTAVRSALQPLLTENPAEIAIVVTGDAAQRKRAAQLAVYCAWVNGEPLPERKKKPARRRLAAIQLYGHRDTDGFAALREQAAGNVLCR
jgi:leucyl aminopeptidase